MAVPTLLAGEVYFYFQDGEEDDFELEYPCQYVNIFNATDEEPVSVPQDMNFMSFSFENATILKIAPEDFDFELVVTVDGDADTYFLEKEDNEWYLTLLPDADGLEISVKVYLAGQAPSEGDQPQTVSMNFNINAAQGTTVANPGEKLSISYFDRVAFTENTLTISDNYASAEVVPGTSFTLSPAEGFVISDITTFIDGVASISQPGEGDKEWYVAVDENPADTFASFFVDIAPEGSETPEQPGEEDPDMQAVITQIENLQWKVEWADFDFIDYTDAEYFDNYAYLTAENGTKTILHANAHGEENAEIIFPESGNYFTVDLSNLNLAAGNYELTIPEGYVELSQYGGISREACPEQYLDLTVGGSVDTEYPVQFSAFMDNLFIITWENVTSLKEANTTGAYIENTVTGDKYDMFFLVDDLYSKANIRINNGNALNVNVTNNYPTLPSGRYRFYLPANYVTFNGTTKGNAEINDFEFEYGAPWMQGRVETNGPSEDNKITMTWIDASEIQFNSAFSGAGNNLQGVTVYDSSDTQTTIPQVTHLSISGNIMTIDLNGLNIEEGACNLVVPMDYLFVTVNGVTDTNDDTYYNFTLGNPSVGPGEPGLYNEAATWSIQSGATVKYGTLVEVNWSNRVLTLLEDAEEVSAYNPTTGIIYLEYGEEVNLSDDKTKLVINLGNLPNNVFRINVPEACVEFDVDGVTYRNQASSLDNVQVDNTGGVDGIADDEGRIRVFNVNGVMILDTDNAAELSNLPKGLYIVNGKKVIR